VALSDLLNHEDPVFRGLTPDQVPPEIADGFAWLIYRDAERDRGVPEAEILSFEAWKAARNG
jgi:hypothetical protein